MTPTRRVRVFDSDTPDYQTAFHTFLAHTDQKDRAHAWLEREVLALPRRRRFVDVGAGTGKLTAWLLPRFDEVVAIEPNPALERELRAACPTARVLGATMLEIAEAFAADFVLCSHVFYYLPPSTWPENLARLLSWLDPGGVLAAAIQNPHSDCMRMLEHFLGTRLDLRPLCLVAEQARTGTYRAHVETVPAHIATADLATACAVAEFILNVLPIPSPPAWDDLETYVERNFRQPNGSYRYSCDQDFLRIQRAA
ncbi:MAG: class I SAM-dependent methyltransferase [Planctomycetaceae bacterium]|nr:class I SAM-dependent methyltransferase [Planctomycetaceae bacterium]